jgi:hypothetical protein
MGDVGVRSTGWRGPEAGRRAGGRIAQDEWRADGRRLVHECAERRVGKLHRGHDGPHVGTTANARATNCAAGVAMLVGCIGNRRGAVRRHGIRVMARFFMLAMVRHPMRHGLAWTGECREHEKQEGGESPRESCAHEWNVQPALSTRTPPGQGRREFVRSSAARSPRASVTASSFAQKCMKNRRGSSVSR